MIAIVASLWVLKNKWIADYYKFLQFIANTFQNEEFILQLYQANKAAADLFEVQEDDKQLKDILGIQTEIVEIPVENPPVKQDLNRSINSDTSHTTEERSAPTSPNPKVKSRYGKLTSQKEATPDQLLWIEAKRKAVMFRIKRKIICKRRLN